MSTVRKVSLTVETGGSEFTINTVDPSPGGSNPRFVTHHLRSAVATLQARALRILEADFGPQEPESRPAPQHHARLLRARLQAAISPEVPVSIVVEPSDKRQSISRTYRTDRDMVELLDALVPVVEELLREQREAVSS